MEHSCPICLETSATYVSICTIEKHGICPDCLRKLVSSTNLKCSLCRRTYDEKKQDEFVVSQAPEGYSSPLPPPVQKKAAPPPRPNIVGRRLEF